MYISREEISEIELRTLIVKSYAGFRHPQVTPLQKLGDKKYVLELWHGPTWAFKDVALQLLGNFFEFFLKRRNERNPAAKEKLTVVGATSGDTGRYVCTCKSTQIYILPTALRSMVYVIKPTSPSSSCTQKVACLLSRKRK